MKSNDAFESKKKKLLDSLILNEILRDKRLIRAFYEVPLENFIPDQYLTQARIYEDAPNLFYFQNRDNYRTISAPHMITIMLQGLALKEDDDLLILGAKSGYIAALAHKLAPKGEIIILEANSEVAKITAQNLKKLKLDEKITVLVKSPLLGIPESRPWQKILVTGAVTQERIHPLLRQLDPKEGVLYAPIGKDYVQIYTQILRINDEYFGKRQLQVRFTPLMTQVELDELELITDFDEVEIKDDPNKVEKTLENIEEKFNGKISIKYASSILDELNFEKKVTKKSINRKIIDTIISFLDFILKTLRKFLKEENIENCFKYIDDIEKQIENLKKYKKFIDIKIKRFQVYLNQLRAYLIIRKDLEKENITNSEIIQKKAEIINLLLEEVNKFQGFIKEAIRYLNTL